MSPRRRRSSAHRRHRFPRPALGAACAALAAMVAWPLLVSPALVKYPTDLDVTQSLAGTFTVLVDPVTAAPLEEPRELDLAVERHLEALPDESGADTVVVRETVHQRAGDLIDLTQVNQYVMDRSTLRNVADERAFAFEPGTPADRAGAYRLHLPFGTSRHRTYEIWGNEIGTTYEIAPDPEQPTGELEGLEVYWFVADEHEVPLTDAYLAELREAVPLPETITLAQVRPHLAAAGVELDALLADLAAVLTPADTDVLLAMAGEPIELEYVTTFQGRLAVEPVTGTEVDLAVAETVAARPHLPNLAEFLMVLGHYPDEPAAVEAVEVLSGLVDGPPIPLFEYAYEQTPASLAHIAGEAASMRRFVLAVTVWAPAAFGVLAIVALMGGQIVRVRRKPRPLDLSTLWDTPAPPDPHDLAERPTAAPDVEHRRR